MDALVSQATGPDANPMETVALEARLERIEGLLSELHDWMRAEQIASLPLWYRHLFAQLVANDFERRYAAQITRTLWQANGARELPEEQIRAAAAAEINTHLKTMDEALPRVKRRDAGQRPYILALVGSSGAGKTTLMYKLAVRAAINYSLRVKVISSDTYKIGSVEGVQTIADILGVPYGIAFEPHEVKDLINQADIDLIILDTAGRSDRVSRQEIAEFITAAAPDETHLVLSATMSQRALQETAALFLGENITYVTFTKIDEAPSLGAMISAVNWMDLPMGYVSNGTVIPDDLLPSKTVPLGQWAVEGVPAIEHDTEVTHV